MIKELKEEKPFPAQILFSNSDSLSFKLDKSLKSLSKSKLQIQAEHEMLNTQIQTIKPSPYLNEYTQRLIRGRKINSYNIYWKNFSQNDIVVSPKRFPFKMLIKQTTKNYRIIKYEVRFSHFVVQINVLNICSNDQYAIIFNSKINHGTFGTIYSVDVLGRKAAIKKIDNKQNRRTDIQSAVREYAFTKVMAALQCGPPIDKIFGFDIIVSSESIYFGLELCIGIESVMRSPESIGSREDKFDQLEMSLLMMHQLGFCHCDIKPFNIMYSPSLNKFVFIDFGLSQYKNVQLGQMKPEKAKGSFFYSCEDMQKIFISRGQQEQYVDLYYNDYYGLMKSKKAFKSTLKNQENVFPSSYSSINQISILNQNNYNSHVQFFHQINLNGWASEHQKSNQQYGKQTQALDQRFCEESSYLIVYVCYLLSQFKIHHLSKFLDAHPQIYQKLNQNLHKIHWIFFELNCNLSLQSIFHKFKQLFLKNCTPSIRSKHIFQNILDPYFRKALLGDYKNNQQYINYNIEHEKQRQRFKKRYHRLQDKSLTQNEAQQIPQNQLLNKQYCQLNEKFYPKQSHKFHHWTLNSSKIDIPLSILSPKIKQKIKEYFLNYCDCVLKKIFYILKDQMTQKINHNKFMMFDIPIIEKCFQQVNIFINDIHLIEQGKIDPQIYTILGLNILIQVIIEYVLNFSIPHLIFYAVEHNHSIHDTIRNQFKKLAFLYHPNLNQQKYQQQFQSNLQNYCAFSAENFRMCLQILIQLLNIYVENNSYTQNALKVEKLVANVVSKFNQIIEYYHIFANQKQHNDINKVLQILIKQMYVFLLDMTINNFFTAQIHCDSQRLQLYYKMFLDIHQISKNTLAQYSFIQLNDQKVYLETTKRILNFILFRTIVPKRLCQKYNSLEETQRFIQFSELHNYGLYSQHYKRLQHCLFLQYFSQLTNQKCYGKAMKEVKALTFQCNKFALKQSILALIQLYRATNNNKLLKMMKTIKTRIFQNKNKNQHKNKSKNKKHKRLESWRRYIYNFIDQDDDNQSQQVNKFQQADQKEFDEGLIQLKEQFAHQTNFNVKQFRIRNQIIGLIKANQHRDINLDPYIQFYQTLLKQIQQSIPKKLELLNFIDPRIIYQRISQGSQQNKPSDDSCSFQQRTMHFKKQIYMHEVLHHQTKFLQTLLIYRSFIKNKQVIRQYWKQFDAIISQLFQGKHLKSLTYLQISGIIKQLQFLDLYLNPLTDPEQSLKARKQFIDSIHDYMEQFSPKNEFFVFEIKNSNYGLDTLSRMYQGEIPTDKFSRHEIKQRIIELFHHMVKNDQVYRFFIQNEPVDRFTAVLIDIAIGQVYEKLSQKSQMLKIKKSVENYKSSVQKEEYIFLFYFLFYLTKFSQMFPCSNYTQTTLMLANLIKDNISKRLKQTKLYTNYKNLQDHVEVITYVMESILKPLIKIHLGIYAVIIYFELLHFLCENGYPRKAKIQQAKNQHPFFADEFQLLLEILAVCYKNQSLHKMETHAKNICELKVFEILAFMYADFEFQNNSKTRFYQIMFFRNFTNPSSQENQNKLFFPLLNIQESSIALSKSEKLLQSRLKGFNRTIVRNFKSPNKFLKVLRSKILKRLTVSIIQKSQNNQLIL